MLANIITVSRILFSLVLFTLSPSTYAFSVLYILCGISDVLDGFVARKLNTASERGARLDSAADIVFSLFYAVKILPLFDIPLYLWVLTALIAVTKIICILLKSKKAHKLSVEHTFLNKLTGLLLFALPLTIRFTDMKYGISAVCVIAAFAVLEEMLKLKDKCQ